MVSIGSIDQLIDAFSASVWIFNGLAIGALLIMRITHEDKHRSFEVRDILYFYIITPSQKNFNTTFMYITPKVYSHSFDR